MTSALVMTNDVKDFMNATSRKSTESSKHLIRSKHSDVADNSGRIRSTNIDAFDRLHREIPVAHELALKLDPLSRFESAKG